MPENTESVVLEDLRNMRAAVDRVVSRLGGPTTPIGHLETSFTHLRTSLAHVQVELAEHSVRSDRMEFRLARIEKNLDWLTLRLPCEGTNPFSSYLQSRASNGNSRNGRQFPALEHAVFL